jgi:hypothetical protein
VAKTSAPIFDNMHNEMDGKEFEIGRNWRVEKIGREDIPSSF